jgi:hypothetical protein
MCNVSGGILRRNRHGWRKEKRKRLNKWQFCRSGRVKIWFVFKKSDITRKANTISGGIITTITLMFKTVTKEITLNRLSC